MKANATHLFFIIIIAVVAFALLILSDNYPQLSPSPDIRIDYPAKPSLLCGESEDLAMQVWAGKRTSKFLFSEIALCGSYNEYLIRCENEHAAAMQSFYEQYFTFGSQTCEREMDQLVGSISCPLYDPMCPKTNPNNKCPKSVNPENGPYCGTVQTISDFDLQVSSRAGKCKFSCYSDIISLLFEGYATVGCGQCVPA